MFRIHRARQGDYYALLRSGVLVGLCRHRHLHHRHRRLRPPRVGTWSHPLHRHGGQQADCGPYLRIGARGYRVPVEPCGGPG